jgi:hypothetical protein
MRNLLPWILLSICLVIIAAMPWRRPDPHHEFAFQLVRNLPEEQSVAGEEHDIGPGTRSGSPDSIIGTCI